MAQTLYKIRQVWQYLSDQGIITNSPFKSELYEIVNFAFETNATMLKQNDEKSINLYMQKANTHLKKAYEEYHKTGFAVVLPYEQYVRFIEACRLCGAYTHDGQLKLWPESEEDYSRRTAKPLAPAAITEGGGETYTEKMANLLARLKQIVSELEELKRQK